MGSRSREDAQRHCTETFAGAEFLVRGFDDLGQAAKFASEGVVNVVTYTVRDGGGEAAAGAAAMGLEGEDDDEEEEEGGRKRPAAATSAAAAGGGKKRKSNSGSTSSPSRRKNRAPRTETQPRKPYKQWEAQYAALSAHHAATGTFAVTGDDDASKKLRKWMSDQRAGYRLLQSGRESKMTDVKMARLRELGFDFDAADSRADMLASRASASAGSSASAGRAGYKPRREWQDMYSKLLEYKEQKGTTIVDRRDKDNAELRAWINEQNMAYRHMKEGKVKKVSLLMCIMYVQFAFLWRHSF